jgi:tetratricopeptide (TPR) repeat protein
MDTQRRRYQAKTLADNSRLTSGQSTPSGSTVTAAISGSPLPLTSISDDLLSASAINAIRQRQYEWALHLLNHLIQRHPDEANYYSNRGLLHLWKKNYDAALNDCDYAIELEPNLDQAYNNRANCYAALGLTVKALVDYERAVDLNPFNSRARINLGITLRSLGDLEAALNCFDEALLFYKLSAFIYVERGRTYHLRGDWNCAIADYRRAQASINENTATPQEQRVLQRVQGWMEELVPNPAKNNPTGSRE